MSVVIIDYGSGNLRSAAKAFERAARESGLSSKIEVTADPAHVLKADRIVLPGVGAFADCKAGLCSVAGMTAALTEAVQTRGRPFLGICVGMQLMADRGLEHGVTEGLGWIPGEVGPIEPTDETCKIPHMGWNALEFEPNCHPLFEGLTPGLHGYFVHGYHLVCATKSHRLATVDYGGPITATVGRDNMVGTQFHPEKSQAVGLKLITNFLHWNP